MVLVRAVRKVHADDIETCHAQFVDGLDGVGLGTDCADDGCSAVVLCWLVFGIELAQPLNLGTSGEMVCGGSHDRQGFRKWRCKVVEGNLVNDIDKVVSRMFRRSRRGLSVYVSVKCYGCGSCSCYRGSWWGKCLGEDESCTEGQLRDDW